MARDYVGTIDDTLNDDFGLPTGVLIGVRTSRCCTRDTTDRATIVPHRNRSSTMFWHQVPMPDDHHPLDRRPDPERVDLGRIQTDLEFLIERVSKLPTRQELALKPLYAMVGSAGIVILWIELFWRYCL